MKIVIVGAGEIGRNIASTLSHEGHDIFVVEQDEARVKSVQEDLDVGVVQGNGARPQVLRKAGVTEGGGD